jgi:hypothetical protein
MEMVPDDFDIEISIYGDLYENGELWTLRIPTILQTQEIIINGKSENPSKLKMESNVTSFLHLFNLHIFLDSSECFEAKFILLNCCWLESVSCFRVPFYHSLNSVTGSVVIFSNKAEINQSIDSVSFRGDSFQLMNKESSSTLFSKSSRITQSKTKTITIFVEDFNFESEHHLAQDSLGVITSNASSFVKLALKSPGKLFLCSQRNYFIIQTSGSLTFSSEFEDFYITELSIGKDVEIGEGKRLHLSNISVSTPATLNSSIEIFAENMILNSNPISLDFTKGIHTNRVLIEEETMATISSLSSDVDVMEIRIKFQMASVPFVQFVSSEIPNATVEMIYTGGSAEAFYVDGWNNIIVDVICGVNLRCDSWKWKWVAEGWPFNGSNSIFEMVCTESTVIEDERCFTIRNIPTPPDPGNEKSSAHVNILFVVGLILGIVALLIGAISLVRRRKRKQLLLFLSDTTGLSSDALLPFEENDLVD